MRESEPRHSYAIPMPALLVQCQIAAISVSKLRSLIPGLNSTIDIGLLPAVFGSAEGRRRILFSRETNQTISFQL